MVQKDLTARNEPAPKRAHVIEGMWATKELRIDGQCITPWMVEERMRDFYILHGVSPFAWGPDADLWGLRATAYGCCAFTVPATWIYTINAHSALEQFFMEQLARLPAADFTLCYTDQELHTAIRGIQCRDRERSRHSRGS